MSTWRRKAIEYLPEHRETINRARTPMAMWIELHLRFEDAVAGGDQHMVKRFLRYADWCMSEEAGRLPSETSTAAACAFYEHLPQRREYWSFFRSWFSHKQFTDLIPVFGYHLSPADVADLKKFYANGK
jgi:hypothetical protein